MNFAEDVCGLMCGGVMEMGIWVALQRWWREGEGARRLRIFITAIIESVFSLTSSSGRHISARQERRADDLVTCD